ncbi:MULTISPECIES: M20/M25/M40 family metallo-hydrolase [unclassified Duganella]|uniref:M20/M25/M40 family metallo-hydrolase n=1 Tax=unclassified Duganella TaxID=2636909 RepID=UPI000E3410ED|nr:MULTISPECIES: M20/M25/M40 family metallo-hydrolase [unclassified Duganella]RFP19543.1 M20/M25/M40 family metallo-hydrolase [Duganella sp. BJB475]RFP36124.1 M20/M25/M40 family metallo-hydrolase [Duganella sp. BJB476]
MLWRRYLVTAALLLGAGLAQAQPAPSSAENRLIEEIGERSRLMPDLEELCDDIGPRLTGSAQLRAAQQWAVKRLASYGAVNAHLEGYDMGRPWQRGIASARLLNANGMKLDVVQKAWTSGTHGVVHGDVAVLDARTWDEFKTAAAGLKGRIVLLESVPRATPEQRKDLPRYLAETRKMITDAQFAGVLFISTKSNSLQEMWGGPASLFDTNAAIITSEHANALKRLLARGRAPRVAMELGGHFAASPATAYNVVADFPGTDPVGEMVILGAHIDSWDLGTGATDNGAGTVAMMEILRAVHALDLRPKRTLRVVLFSGEEQGLLGSKAYVAAHADELSKIQAVLVQDSGAGRITGFPDMKQEAWYAPLQAALAPAKALGPIDIVYAMAGGSDFEPFVARGIPAFPPGQDPRDYRTHTQHSQADTIDHVVKADLVQATQVLAVLAWGLLNGERLPRAVP